MKFHKTLLLLSFLVIAMLCISSVAASEDNIDGNLTTDSFDSNLQSDNNLDCLKAVNENNSVLSSPQTIIVEEIEDDHNEMSQPTIQKAIDSANAGDTIIVEGKSYVHCHFIINKKLTIKSNVGTTMEVCSSTQGSGYRGIFYISPSASGTVIEGFTINNNVYNENDYGILVKANDVEIRNCSINHIGYSDAVRIENAKNCLVENVTASNANNAISIKNSQNVNVRSSNLKSSKNGITIVDSSSTTISGNNISNNNIAGVSFSGTGKYLTVSYNNITENTNGIRLTSFRQCLYPKQLHCIQYKQWGLCRL